MYWLLFLIPLLAANEQIIFKLRMPNITTDTHDMYLVTPTKLEYDDAYIVGFEPRASADKIHHLMIFGCSEPAQTAVYWEVGDMGGICGSGGGGVDTILWAWALDAPTFRLPEGVGFHVGHNAKINYIMLEIHYKNMVATPDSSGVDVILVTEPPPHLAGIYLFATGSTVIPPGKETLADTTCHYDDDVIMTPFAFRTHTHKLGTQVSAWRQRGKEWTLLGTGDPQKPQMFYLMKGEANPIEAGDILHARCTYDAAARNHTTYIGSTGNDEMCNFYMMYWMNATEFRLESGCYHEKRFVVPESALPVIPVSGVEIGFSLDKNWTSPILEDMGQVAGMSHTSDNGELVVFYRGPNDWSSKRWFDSVNIVLYRDAIITTPTIAFLNPESGDVINQLGAGRFIMPHGIYLDQDDNIFVTDVALHQVFKFEKNTTEPSLVLGIKLTPGKDKSHFCKPTAVVVDNDKNIYVSDGYCNSRVVKFNSKGKFMGEFGSYSTQTGLPGGMYLVHDLTIDHEREVVYVADRENGQIHVMLYDGNFTHVFTNPGYGKIFAIDFSLELRQLFAVNVSESGRPSKVMSLNPYNGDIVEAYPKEDMLETPHCLTYIFNESIFVGEISKPFHLWKLAQVNIVEKEILPPRLKEPFFTTLTHNIPTSFVIIMISLAAIPIAYLFIVVAFRLKNRNKAPYDRNGFQKLLRDYDSSEDEDDLVFKNSQINYKNVR